MIIAIDITISLLLTALNYFLLCGYLPGEKPNSTVIEDLKINRSRQLYLILAVAVLGAEAVIFQTVYKLELPMHLKLITLSSVVLPCATVDYRIQKIPNLFLVEGLILRAILLFVELFAAVKTAVSAVRNNPSWCGTANVDAMLHSIQTAAAAVMNELKNDFLGAAVCGGFFLLMLLVFKNSIGMGDIKLFALIGLYKGLWGAIGSVFLSLCASFIVSLFLLISRKKTRNDSIPFGPCIFAGTILSNCLFGM